MQTSLCSDVNYSLTIPAQEVVSGTSNEETSLLAGKRVVIVEDEGITQMQLSKILKRQGLDVVGAAISGPEGVEIVLHEKPDLVLMDICMPGDYDGLEAARRVLAAMRVCLVMLTAFSEEGYQEEASQIGASGYVIKPIDQDTLLPQLEIALRMHQQQ